MSELAVKLNGEARRVQGPTTLLDLLGHLGLDQR